MDASLKDIDWQALADAQLSIDAQLLQAMHAAWPWFVWPDLVALEQGTADASDAQRLRARIALATGDTQALGRVLEPDSDFSDFYPDMQPVRLSTNATIDAFLNRFGTEESDRETDMLTRLIFDPGTATPVTEQEGEERREERKGEKPASASTDEEPEKDATASRIDAFLAVSRQKPRTPEALLHLEEEERKDEGNGSCGNIGSNGSNGKEESPQGQAGTQSQTGQTAGPSLSLSLARMMIRNRNYTKALEILNGLNLADNEKSIIFADQIRFLRKLIIIQEHQNR